MAKRFPIVSVARGLALFLGGFTLLNLVGELRHTGFDASLWWNDTRFLPSWLSHGVFLTASAVLLPYGLRPCRGRRCLVMRGLIAVLLGLAATNLVTFHVLAWRGSITAGCPLAFSWLVLGGLILILRATRTNPSLARAGRQTEAAILLLVMVVCSIGFPLAQMCCFGMTDYHRPADTVVILGARVYADGSPSQALADRVRTGCSLYHNGLVRRVILSGGPGDADVHETEGMRRMAIRLGVRPQDILLDEQGLNTQATVDDTCDLFTRYGCRRILVVSHFYHLPRIKLAYQRRGWEVCTVPARESRRLTALPLYMMREVAALWVYCARPLWA